MIRFHYFFILIFTCLGANFSHAQESQNLDRFIDEIELEIGEEWCLQKTENGFSVSFCRSCAKNYTDYLNTTSNRELTRNHFFAADKLDSISCSSLLYRYTGRTFKTDQEGIDYYNDYIEPYSTLQFDVVFEDKWTIEHFDSILANNKLLEEAILSNSLYYNSHEIFADYRYQLPSEFFKNYTIEYDFYFERLPYESLTIDRSIFIVENDAFFFCEPLLIDKNDEQFFEKDENLLETERQRVLKLVAKVLKIEEYTELVEPEKIQHIELR